MTHYNSLQRLVSKIRRLNDRKSSSLMFSGVNVEHDFVKTIEMFGAITTFCVYEEISDTDFVLKLSNVRISLEYFIKHLERFHNKRTDMMLHLLQEIQGTGFMSSAFTIDITNIFEVKAKSKAFFHNTRVYLMSNIF